MRSFLLFTIVVTLLFACVPMTPTRPLSRMTFPENEYQALAKSGNATIKGQAFLKTRGGDVKTAAGDEVQLNPVTSYSMEWYEKSYLMGRPIEKADSRLENFVAKQVADSNGRFTFKNVPPGEYFITALILWEAATGYQGSLQRQGGLVTKRIAIKDGEEIDVIVTR